MALARHSICSSKLHRGIAQPEPLRPIYADAAARLWNACWFHYFDDVDLCCHLGAPNWRGGGHRVGRTEDREGFGVTLDEVTAIGKIRGNKVARLFGRLVFLFMFCIS